MVARVELHCSEQLKFVLFYLPSGSRWKIDIENGEYICKIDSGLGDLCTCISKHETCRVNLIIPYCPFKVEKRRKGFNFSAKVSKEFGTFHG